MFKNSGTTLKFKFTIKDLRDPEIIVQHKNAHYQNAYSRPLFPRSFFGSSTPVLKLFLVVFTTDCVSTALYENTKNF